MSVRTRFVIVPVLIAVVALLAHAESANLGIGCPKGVTIPAQADIAAQSVTGGDSTECTVTLNQVVEGQDQVVNIETDHPEVFTNFPETVVVPVGYQSVTFTLYTVTVSGSVQATVTASCNGGQASDTLTVNP